MVVIFEVSVSKVICILIFSESLLEFESEYEYDANFINMLLEFLVGPVQESCGPYLGPYIRLWICKGGYNVLRHLF